MDRTKIYLISQTYPNDHLGDTSFIDNEIGYLKEQFDITVICLEKKLDNQVLHEGMSCLYFNFSMMGIVRYLPLFFVDRSCRLELMDILHSNYKAGRLLSRIIASMRVYAAGRWFEMKFRKAVSPISKGIVYSYWADYPIIGLLRVKDFYQNCRFISRIHGYELYDEQNKAGRIPFRHLLNEKIDRLVFIGENPKKYYLAHYPSLLPQKTSLCRLGIKPINVSTAGRVDDKMLLVSCSSVIPLKRVELIIRALAKYHLDYEIRWVHFGDGEKMKEIEGEARNLLGNKSNVEYDLRGYVDNDDIRAYYAENVIDCFITTSSTEGCPVSVMEALSAGTPIIGTSVGDIPYMIDGNGELLPAAPLVEEITKAIERMAGIFATRDHSNDYTKMRRRSRELFDEMFDNRNNTEKFINEVLNTEGQ